MPYLTDLAEVARRTGYPVTEVPGWRTRGHGEQPEVRGVVAHHTAGATAGGDYPSLAVVRDGRPGLDGPLSHLGLGRSGRIYVIAAGRCWHNAPSTSDNHTNSRSIGIEAENDGRQSWPAPQLDAYKRLCAELCRAYGVAVSQVKAHREVNTQKPDPHSVNMAEFRADVATLLAGQPLEDDVPKHANYRARDLETIIPPGEWRYAPFTHLNGDPLPSTYYSVAKGPAYYAATLGVRFSQNAGEEHGSPPPGTEFQVRAVEVIERGDEFVIVESAPIDSPTHVAGNAHFTYHWQGNAQKGHRVRFRVAHFAPHPLLLDSTQASVLTWEY